MHLAVPKGGGVHGYGQLSLSYRYMFVKPFSLLKLCVFVACEAHGYMGIFFICFIGLSQYTYLYLHSLPSLHLSVFFHSLYSYVFIKNTGAQVILFTNT